MFVFGQLPQAVDSYVVIENASVVATKDTPELEVMTDETQLQEINENDVFGNIPTYSVIVLPFSCCPIER